MAERLTRSVAHRRPGDERVLPDLGAMGSLDRATGWLNSPPLSTAGLRGRVVLVDFWTYTCVNWLRTAPYLRAWHERYFSAGLTIVGVHTPEFEFEHDVANVTDHTRALGIDYPVALDADYGVWDDFANHYWPALYLADADGRVRFQHFGEGEYALTEMAIQQLLVEAGADVDATLVDPRPTGLEVAADWGSLGSPETYLGWAQSTGFVSERVALDREHDYGDGRGFAGLRRNTWDLAGTWMVTRSAATAHDAGARVAFAFRARDVNLVMTPGRAGTAVPFRVTVDGGPVGAAAGTDVDANGRGILDTAGTYQLVRQGGEVEDRVVEIEFFAPGAELYCFTFG